MPALLPILLATSHLVLAADTVPKLNYKPGCRPDGQNVRALGPPVTRVAKRYELRAARSSRCEEVLQW